MVEHVESVRSRLFVRLTAAQARPGQTTPRVNLACRGQRGQARHENAGEIRDVRCSMSRGGDRPFLVHQPPPSLIPKRALASSLIISGVQRGS